MKSCYVAQRMICARKVPHSRKVVEYLYTTDYVVTIVTPVRLLLQRDDVYAGMTNYFHIDKVKAKCIHLLPVVLLLFVVYS